ncbi:MAG: hypothetical protein ACE5JG_00120 [Planctomycetota bacterium]
MGGRRIKLALAALLGAACLAGVVFVFGEMSARGRPFGAARGAAPAPPPPPSGAPVPAVEPPPEPESEPPEPGPAGTEPAPETPPEQPEEPREEEGEEGREESREPARLVLELVRPAEEPDRRVILSVTDRVDTPLAGVLIVVRDQGAVVYRTRTDAAGRAEFVPYQTERGPFEVDALAFGYEPGSAAGVLPGADVTIALDLTPSVEGEVTGPVRGRGFVELITPYGTFREPIRADGTFLFTDLEEGEAVLRAQHPPYVSKEQPIVLRRGQRRYVRLRLRGGRRIRLRGEIHGWPGRGQVRINGVPVAVPRTGKFIFDEAVPGAVNEIEIDAERRALVRERFNVAGGWPWAEVEFRLRGERKIRGRLVSAANRRPLAGQEILLGVNFGDPRNDRVPDFPIALVPVVRTDRNGRFEIGRLDPRLIYLVSATAPGHARFLHDAVPSGFLTIRLATGPYVAGTLRGRGGVPRAAVVHAFPMDPRPKGYFFNRRDWNASEAVRDRRGYYRLDGLLAGNYHIVASAPGWGAMETTVYLGESQGVRLDFRLRRSGVSEGERALLERLPPSAYDPEIDVPPDDFTTLEADLTRPMNEAPFPSIRVEFFYDGLEFQTPLHFDRPTFTLTGLPEGVYRAVLTHATLRIPAVFERLTLERGKVARLELGR